MLVEATVHLKILAYDRNAARANRSKLVLGVLYPADARRAGLAQQAMVSAFRSLARNFKVHGATIWVVPLYSTVDTLKQQLIRHKIQVLYVAPQLTAESARIARITTALKIPTLCSSRAQAAQGLAVAVDMNSGRPQITVNLLSARESGMILSARLLRMVKLLR